MPYLDNRKIKDKDLISIVVPSYNSREYLRDLVNSVIDQTYKRWELIVVDDGSTDGTAQMFDNEITDERIRYYERPPFLIKGAQSCRNYGKRIARGEYLCFFDADDWICPTCLEKRLACIKTTGADYCIFPSGVFAGVPSASKKTHVGIPSGINVLTSFLNNYYQHAVWTNIYKADAVKDIWWDEQVLIYQDFDFSVQCHLKGLSFRFSHEKTPDYLYRIHTSRETISKRNVTTGS